MTRHSINDYGASTDTVPPTADEWGTEHLPLTTVALAAAVPVIEAEVRAKIAAEIEARLCDPYCHVGACHGLHEAARMARGTS